MIRIANEVKNLFKSDNVHKELVISIPDANITITNNDIYEEAFSIKEAINNDDNLTFMGCIASSMVIEVTDIVEDIQGMYIGAEMYLMGVEEPVPLFHGYVADMTNTTHEEYSTQLTCYDALYKINNMDITSWYNSLTFPITVKNMRDSFFNYVGVTQKADYLANDPMTVNKTIEDAVITGEKIIKAICQINGRYGRIGRDGLFEYVQLVEGTEAIYPSETLYPADDLFPSAENATETVNKAVFTSTHFENYRVTPIDKVQLVDKEGQIVASTGSGTNTFTVKDNPLIWGKTGADLASVVRNLYNDISGLWYTPATVDCVGLPYVECGDFVLLAARRSIVRAYVLGRELRGVQSLKDSYTARGDKKQSPYVPSIKQQVTANTQAISNEVSRATNAETAERNRATAVENNLNNSIGSVNNRVSGVYSELVDTQRLVATKASIADLNVTNNLVATKASVEELNAVKATVNSINANYVNANYVRSQFTAGLSAKFAVAECTTLVLAGNYIGGATWSTLTSRVNYLWEHRT